MFNKDELTLLDWEQILNTMTDSKYYLRLNTNDSNMFYYLGLEEILKWYLKIVNQPLHKACDDIHMDIMKLCNIELFLDQGKIITTYKTIGDIKSNLQTMLTTVREIALRTEGEYDV
jgi:hypothetical protein